MRKQIKVGDYVKVIDFPTNNGMGQYYWYTLRCEKLGFKLEKTMPTDWNFAKVVYICNRLIYIVEIEGKYYTLYKEYARFFCRNNFEIRKEIYKKEREIVKDKLDKITIEL